MNALVLVGCLAFVPMASAQDAPPAAPPQGDAPAAAPAATEEPRGLRVYEADAMPGYTLIAPLTSYRTLLLDMEGEVVHEWKSAFAPGGAVYLLPNGNVLRVRRDLETDIFEGGGISGGIDEIAPDGTLVWGYSIKSDKIYSHHDILQLPNGHVLAIVWERKSGTKAVEAGRDKKRIGGELWADAIYEIEKQPPTGGRIVWEWHSWDHLIQDHDKDRANFGDVAAHPELIDINGEPADDMSPAAAAAAADAMKQAGYLGGDAKDAKGRPRDLRGADWMHCNAVDYNPALDQIVISSPHFSEIWVIDHSTTTEEAKGHTGGKSGKGGDLLYRWGNPKNYRAGTANDQRLFGQHNIQWIEPGLPGAGNFLVFNNGEGRPRAQYSSADEFTAPMDAAGHYTLEPEEPYGPDELVWRYGGKEGAWFFSSFISGVQRLKNGNTLICQGADGRVFEVTAEGQVVWEFANIFGGEVEMSLGKHQGPAQGPGGKGFNPFALFRATRIPMDHPALQALGLVVPSK